MAETTGDRIRSRFPEAVLESHQDHGDDTVVVAREDLVQVLAFLKDDLGFIMPVDVTAVDMIGLGPRPQDGYRHPMHPMLMTETTLPLGAPPGPRFEVVYHVRRLSDGALFRVKVMVAEDDAAIPTSTGVYKGFNWFEREVYDMFGVRFDGHPDLRRILLYPEFQGYPLRKDYPRRGYQPLMDMPCLEGDPVPGRD
jgi:NADH-quinone oxidoreductase subunit C